MSNANPLDSHHVSVKLDQETIEVNRRLMQKKTKPSKGNGTGKWRLFFTRTLLVFSCSVIIGHQLFRVRMLNEYPSPYSRAYAQPGEGVSQFDRLTLWVTIVFCLINIVTASYDDPSVHLYQASAALTFSLIMFLPLLGGSELKSSYKVLTDRIRLMNRDIGFWQLEMLVNNKKPTIETDSFADVVDKFQKLGCCGITNSSSWTDGIIAKTNQSLVPLSCCDLNYHHVCTDNLCSCGRVFPEGCLGVAFSAMDDYFMVRYILSGSMTILAVLSMGCYYLTQLRKNTHFSNTSDL